MCAKCHLLRCQNRALAGENRRLKHKLTRIASKAQSVAKEAQKTVGKKSGVPAGRYAYELGKRAAIKQLQPAIAGDNSAASLLLALMDCAGSAENS